MGGLLGTRLVQAGTLDRSVLGRALAMSSALRISPVEAMVRCGAPEEHLASFGASASGLPRVSPSALAQPAEEWLRRLPLQFVRRGLLVPIRAEGSTVVVAVVDPFDRHVLDEAHRLLRRPLRAEVGTVGEVLSALTRVLGALAEPEPRSSFALAGRASAGQTERLVGNVRPAGSRQKSGEFAAVGGLDEPSGSRDLGPATDGGSPPSEGTAKDAGLDRWDVGVTARAPVRKDTSAAGPLSASNDRRRFEREARPLPAPQEDVGAALATIRAGQTREAVIGALLSACLVHARQAFCFRLRDGRLEGVDSAGSSLGAVAVRRIVLPLSAGSTMHRVLVEGQPHLGPLFAGPTDQVLRAAIGSRGGRVSMHGLWIEGRPIALVVADDVRTGDLGHERIGALAHAASTALRRLLAERP